MPHQPEHMTIPQMEEMTREPAGTDPEPRENFIPLPTRAKMVARHVQSMRDMSASEILQVMILGGADAQKVMDEFHADKKRWPMDSDDDIMRRVYGDAKTPMMNAEEEM